MVHIASATDVNRHMDGHVLELFLRAWRGDIIMLLGGKEGVEKIYEQLQRIINVAVACNLYSRTENDISVTSKNILQRATKSKSIQCLLENFNSLDFFLF